MLIQTSISLLLALKICRLNISERIALGFSSLAWSRQSELSKNLTKIEKTVNFLTKFEKKDRLPSPELCDMLLFCNGKTRYRAWLRDYRHETQKPSPGLEMGTKKFLEILTTTNQNVLQGCWKRTGIKRFASHQVSLKDFVILTIFRIRLTLTKSRS